MILKLRGVDPRGMARLNQLVCSKHDLVQIPSARHCEDDNRLLSPVVENVQIVKIVSSKAETFSDEPGVFMEVVVEIADCLELYDFFAGNKDVGASRPQHCYRTAIYPTSRAIIDAVLDCLGVFPDAIDDPCFLGDGGNRKKLMMAEGAAHVGEEFERLAEAAKGLCQRSGCQTPIVHKL